ncbi:MAG: sugar phosphate nucleotidyltransferase [Eubacteriales bacterium]|nr:sugar phosphate nucleotidyltransferase [Eubacteriales bacterium]
MANPVLVVMAAGMGSRYGGLKQIDPVGPNGQIIMNYSIYDAWKAGFRRVIFIIKEELLDAFHTRIGNAAEKLMQVDYVFQSPDKLPAGCTMPEGRTKPLGTGHAVYCVRGAVDEPFAVINADDFYGAEAFRCMYDYLKDAKDDTLYRYCMVGYRVENTLTENGTVARGICHADADGYLTDIVERTAISRGADGVISDPEEGAIPEGTLVSMNMWGFTPSFLDELESGLTTFMQTELPNNPMKGEYYLPFAVDHLIKTGHATAKVLQTSAQWYGVTYQQDKPVVVEALRRMTEDGLYPAE